MLLRHGFTARSLARQWARSYAAATAAVKKPRGRPRKIQETNISSASGWEESMNASLRKELSLAKRLENRNIKKAEAKKEANAGSDIDSGRKADEGQNPIEAKGRQKATTANTVPATSDPAGAVLAKARTRAPKTTASAEASKSSAPNLPPRLRADEDSRYHHNLSTFLSHAAKNSLSPTSTVYRGTHFEYTVQASLAPFQIALARTGRSNDLGIDLLGTWALPSKQCLQVLAQCKATAPKPSMVRELEGAYAGAPAGWRGEGVLALLVLDRAATKGVREAMQRSRWPVGVLVVTREGDVRGFVWNAVAEEKGLAGLGVTVRYSDGTKRRANGGKEVVEVQGEKGEVAQSRVDGNIALTWMGQPWVGEDMDSVPKVDSSNN